MESQNDSLSTSQYDYALPLFLSGVVISVVCIVLCGIIYLFRDSVLDDLAIGSRLLEPTPTREACPFVKEKWTINLEDDFNNNDLEWSLGKNSDIYAESNTKIEDGQLIIDISPSEEGAFFQQSPVSNKSLTDFYFTAQMRQTSEFIEGVAQGLIFRVDGSDFYFFNISNNGEVALQVWDSQDEWQLPIGSQHTVKPEEINNLAILNTEEQTIFCVNDNIALTLDEVGYIFGQFGVAISLQPGQKDGSFEFDDFKLYVPTP